MFSDLYDYLSILFSGRWPKANGAITAVNIRYEREQGLIVLYQFSVGEDGPYTGEDSWWNRSDTDVKNISEKLQVGQAVVVRYRRDNPSVNKLDHARGVTSGTSSGRLAKTGPRLRSGTASFMEGFLPANVT